MARLSTPSRIRRSARTLCAAALALGLAAGCTSHTDSGNARLAQADSWSSVAGGPSNSGRAHGSVSDAPELLWSRPLGAPLSGVASADGLGTFFQATVSDRGCNFFALTADDGRKRWCLRLPTEGPRITATVDGRGSLFIPMYGGVGAIAAEGENRWFAETEGIPTTVTLLDNRNLLTISHLGIARVINTQTGLDASPETALAGEIAPSEPGYGSPWCATGERGCPTPGPAAVDTDTGAFYLTAWQPGEPAPELVAMRYTDGEDGGFEELWRVELEDGRLGLPVVLSNDRDAVFVHSDDGALVAYSTADGARLWSAPVGYIPDTPPALLPDGTLVTGGRSTTVWRGTNDKHADDAGPAPVVAIRTGDDSDDDREVWRRNDLRQLTNPVATDDGRVLVAVRSGEDDDEPDVAIHVLNGETGETLHEIAVPAASGPVSGLTVDSDERIALSTALGAVYVFE